MQNNIIQEEFYTKVVDYINNLIAKARVKIDSTWIDLDIFKTIEKEGVIRKYVYLEEEEGVVEEAQLLASDGTILAIKEYSIEKEKDGLVLTFQFEVKIEESNLGYIDAN